MIEQLALERAEAVAERYQALAARDAALGVTPLTHPRPAAAGDRPSQRADPSPASARAALTSCRGRPLPERVGLAVRMAGREATCLGCGGVSGRRPETTPRRWVQQLDRHSTSGKLVRDRIPQIIREDGAEPVTYIAGRRNTAAG
ncbi:hypothetical protein [Streptomyces sp. NPDC008001]|uniref:hypothetical protein n=1 Tax=Streptomyces sp. NPDC008001 TaxID=3364804 RepID=UPI0036E4CBA5